jgi:hypothetical protein
MGSGSERPNWVELPGLEVVVGHSLVDLPTINGTRSVKAAVLSQRGLR